MLGEFMSDGVADVGSIQKRLGNGTAKDWEDEGAGVDIATPAKKSRWSRGSSDEG